MPESEFSKEQNEPRKPGETPDAPSTEAVEPLVPEAPEAAEIAAETPAAGSALAAQSAESAEALAAQADDLQEEASPDAALPSLKETVVDIGRIAWPSITELILTSLAGIVDQIMVGKLHPYAISAVGLTNQPKLLLLACFFAFNVGSTALVARFRGAGRQGDANRVLRQNLMLTLIVSVALSIVGYLFARPMLLFMGSESEQTLAWAVSYFRIQMIGLSFSTIGMAVTAALRGVGNTRASLVLNTVSNVVNVILNYCLIYGHFGFPMMGVEGASLATIIGQMVACAGALVILFRARQYVFLTRYDSFKLDFPLIKRIARIGMPAMGEQLCMRFGMTMFVRTVTTLGDLAFATHNIGMSLMNLCFMSGQAFGIAATTLVGQSLGRRRKDLAFHYARITGYMGQAASLLIALCLVLFREPLIAMFIGLDVEAGVDPRQIVVLGAQILLVLAALQPFQSSQLVLTGALRGAGDTRYTMIVVLVGMAIVRPALSYLAVSVLDFGLVGAWWSMFADQFTRFVLIRVHFVKGKWMERKV